MKMTQCPGCGAQMPVLMSYCTKCGEAIAAKTTEAATQSSSAATHNPPTKSLLKGIYPPFVIIGVFVALVIVAMLYDASGDVIRIVGGLLLFIAGVLVYFLPSLIADKRKHHNKLPIFLVNLILGWSLLGWIAALIWSVMAVKPNNNGVLTGG